LFDNFFSAKPGGLYFSEQKGVGPAKVEGWELSLEAQPGGQVSVELEDGICLWLSLGKINPLDLDGADVELVKEIAVAQYISLQTPAGSAPV
jgi:hypothetical protein